MWVVPEVIVLWLRVRKRMNHTSGGWIGLTRLHSLTTEIIQLVLVNERNECLFKDVSRIF